MRFAFGLLVCLFFAGVYSRSDEGLSRRGRELCADCDHIFVGTTWPGGDTSDSPIPGIDNARDCCAVCQSMRTPYPRRICAASVFQSGQCYLKNIVYQPTDCMTCESVNFNEPDLDPKYNPDYGHDRYGGDIPGPFPTYEGVSDPNVCGQYCEDNPECIAFIWRRDHWHCWLKNQLNSLTECPACVLGYRPE